ncbi:hypothetical protein IGS61_24130 [Janthinobacterium sp. FW305-129]|uniref:hypothetical protein n=1 Tax=Janthinobacterium sp. FW305-129 TaxID=2775054 RepID=UPI001E549E51|nr:hypothetical protein [Janthinobacterium sp. FW305-129]MCC7600598.1 hypothetical protein [Janthinobacterium sp. FW305-129]
MKGIGHMARLKEIRVVETPISYSNQHAWSFHPGAHHVRQLLMHFLPSDFVLDGSSLLSVIFGEKPAGEAQCSQVLGCTSYYVEDFDIGAYMACSPSAQQERMLLELTAVLVRLASGAEAEAVNQAARRVRDCAFTLRIPVRKLWRSSPDKQYRVEVYRCLGPAIGEVWQAHLVDKAGKPLAVDGITGTPGYLDRTSHFSKSRWDGALFQIVHTTLNSVVYSLDTARCYT